MAHWLRNPWFWFILCLVAAGVLMLVIELSPSLFHDTYEVFQ